MKSTIATSSVQTANTCNPIHEAVAVPPTLIKKKELATRLSVSSRTIDEWVRKITRDRNNQNILAVGIPSISPLGPS